MLGTADNTRSYTVLLTGLISLQFLMMALIPLFGDESFYWLEGQYLDWSYAELPGLTAWMIRFSTEIFGNHYFAVRLPGHLAFLSSLLCLYKLSLNHSSSDWKFQTLLLLSTPMIFLIGTMALPDVWMLSCAVWFIYFTIQAQKSNQTIHWIMAGLVIAIAINVHIRMWLWLFISALTWMWCMKDKKHDIIRAIKISFPIGLMGLIPVLLFNMEQGFPLLQFQLSERQPWEFQAKNLSILLAQFLLISPLIFFYWLKTSSKKNHNPQLNWIVLTALIHFIFYALGSVFADGLRTTVHWMLISYFPVLGLLSCYVLLSQKEKTILICSGLLTSVLISSYVYFSDSNLKSRWIQNSSYWPELAQEVQKLQKETAADTLIADHFMTASQLSFELDLKNPPWVLDHDLNKKHGRSVQLDILGLLISKSQRITQPALFILEDSALKLQNKDEFFASLCAQLDSAQLVKSLNHPSSQKLYHLFLINQSESCELAPIFYLENDIQAGRGFIKGWALNPNKIESLSIKNQQGKEFEPRITLHANEGFTKLFPRNIQRLQGRVSFEFNADLSEGPFQIIIRDSSEKKHSSRFYQLN